MTLDGKWKVYLNPMSFILIGIFYFVLKEVLDALIENPCLVLGKYILLQDQKVRLQMTELKLH